MRNNRTIAVLHTWGQLGRQLAQLEVSVARRWVSASPHDYSSGALFKALAGELSSLLDESAKLLEPLADPLRTNLRSPLAKPWLSHDREEGVFRFVGLDRR
jgi:hypothetical protein